MIPARDGRMMRPLARLGLLLLAFLAAATTGRALQVEFRGGIKLTRSALTDVVVADTSYYYYYTVLYEDYVGLTAEALVSAVRNLYLRVEVADFRLFTNPSLGGGWSANLFRDLATDVLYVVPVGRNVSPLVYAGVSLSRVGGKPSRDYRGFSADAEARAGLGGEYRPAKRLSVFVEGQLLTWYVRLLREIDDPNLVRAVEAGIFGLPRLSAGVRYVF